MKNSFKELQKALIALRFFFFAETHKKFTKFQRQQRQKTKDLRTIKTTQSPMQFRILQRVAISNMYWGRVMRATTNLPPPPRARPLMEICEMAKSC